MKSDKTSTLKLSSTQKLFLYASFGVFDGILRRFFLRFLLSDQALLSLESECAKIASNCED